MRKCFKDTMLELAARDDRVVILLGDIGHFLFNAFQQQYPTRFFNMGICENTLVSVAAGLSSQGFHPFVHTIAPFITERCLEQIKLDLAYNQLGANIVTTGASFDYAWDGATHHCYTDLAILRLIPGLEVLQPGSPSELKTLLISQYANGKPTYFRLSDHSHGLNEPIRFGKANVLADRGAAVTVMTAGPIAGNVVEACRELPVNLVYFSTIKPIDKEAITRFRHTRILVVQDAFGLAEAIAEVPDLAISTVGLPDQFCVWYGTVNDLRKAVGLDPAAIRAAVEMRIKEQA